MSGSTLRVDRLAREFWNKCAIAAGMNDRDAALEVCREAFEIEQAYELRLKTGDAAPRPGAASRDTGPANTGKPIRISAKFAGSCQKCGTRHGVGDPVWWIKGARGVDCIECGGANR